MKTMNLKAISALVAVGEHQSYSAAAEAMGCSKAFLSQQIKQLETDYKIQLVHRTTRKVRLTKLGEQFVAQCRVAFNQIESAESDLLEDQDQLSGLIRITSIGGIFGEDYIAPSIYKFMLAHPDIKIELDFSSAQEDLLTTTFDIAIRFGELPDSSLVARHLINYRPQVVASERYLALYGEPKHPRDLYKHKLITGTVRNWFFKGKRQEIEINTDGQLKCGNGQVMLNACEQGLGVARLPSMYVADSLKTGKLQRLLTPWEEMINPCSVIYPPGQYRLKRVQALVEWLVNDLSE